jgi:Xaa-Pro dipeptidase
VNNTIPPQEIRQRIAKLQSRLTAEGFDAALLSYAIDVYYFSGTRQNSVLWIPADDKPVLLVRKSLSRALQESSLDDIRPFPPSKDLPGIFGKDSKRIGLTFDVLPVQHYNFYRDLLGGSDLKDVSAINRELRGVKSDWELQQMRLSGSMLSDAFSRIPDFLKPGMREIELAAEFESLVRRAGIGGYLRIRGFNQEITGLAAHGSNAALPGCFDGPVTGKGQWTAAPYGPSADVIEKGLPIIVDYGGFYNGYIVDMTRIFSFGRLDAELERAFRVSLDIQDWIRDHLLPGKICEDIFQGAAKMATDAGLSANFMGPLGAQAKFVGHGTGLELDELPVLAPRFKAPLKAGNVVAVEPKFLFPGRGAIGIENTFAITELGCEKLTSLPDNIIYL